MIIIYECLEENMYQKLMPATVEKVVGFKWKVACSILSKAPFLTKFV